MNPKQSVFRVRRRYNQWVNNQTLEDFALRFTAKRARRFSFSQIANTALGSISFLALEAIGAALTLNYGFANAAWAIFAVSTIIFLLAIPICFHAAKSGLDIDLLTRGAGFGYIGSTITSLIYASFTFIFFALETAIMAIALEWVIGLPLFIGYVICALIVIPLVTHGITFISKFQRSTQTLWILLQIIPLGIILYSSPSAVFDWLSYEGSLSSSSNHSSDLLHFGAACAVIFALVAQIGEQVDYLRFMPKLEEHNRKAWWLTLFSAGPGWVVIGAVKMLVGGLLATFAVNQGLSPEDAADPTRMYANVFGQAISIPSLSMFLAAIFVIISQLKINVTNAYAGSIAWSNFFSRLTHNHPGRVVWLVFNVAIALVLMELGIYQAFEHILSGYGLLAVAWLGSVVGDLGISKPLKLSPQRIEFIRAHLYAINPVGVGSMGIAVIGGLLCYTGVFGNTLQSLAHFVTLFLSLISSPLITILTKSKFFIARPNNLISTSSEANRSLKCCICENNFEQEDMAKCPAYEGNICSLCCSLDARCDDICKPNTHKVSYHIERIKQQLPSILQEFFNIRLINFLGLMFFAMLISGSLLAVIYVNAVQQSANIVNNEAIKQVIVQIFFVLQIALGVVAWLFVLTNSSRRVAVEESQIQTQRLIDEIAAHDETDRQLQLAKEQAEAANNAKSRYLTGLSHELRTPLNSMLGYAQLLTQDTALSYEHQRQMFVIKRSGEHLADLIEGLLDISKIEAGRLDIHRNKVAIGELIEQLVDMFRPQAISKGLAFNISYFSPLPTYVMTDEKRLRQILINILSNAIKYTHEGSIDFSIKYRNQVAEFTISDTGIGIPLSERERIFKPFERVRTPDVPQVTGTGLGLTITRLLIDIMGGELRLDSRKPAAESNILTEDLSDNGSIFTVSLMMSSVHNLSTEIASARIISGYIEKSKNIVVLDDDPFHRGLIFETLNPLGFNIFESPNINFAKEHLSQENIDLFILDVNLPDGSGWEFAKYLRQRDIQAPIMMISADAEEGFGERRRVHNDYLIKPIKIADLLDKLQSLLNLHWQYKSSSDSTFIPSLLPQDNKKSGRLASDKKNTQLSNSGKPILLLNTKQKNTLAEHLIRLEELANSGHISGVRSLLNQLLQDPRIDNDLKSILKQNHDNFINHLENFDLIKIGLKLRVLINECYA